jgi:2-phosphosulfolactate phosphatase
VTSPHDQSQYQVRFDWGLEGAATIAADADVIVVVDVLSFTTTVGIALENGVEVLPFPGGDAAAFAAEHGAIVAGEPEREPSLSPSSIAREHAGTRVVIPSPNGSRLSARLAGHAALIVAGSLRNRTAVAQWVLARQAERGDRFIVAVIGAGEAREDGSIRFAVEDQLGAGAIVDALAAVGIDYCSPEAAAAAAFTSLRNAVGHLVSASASGKELIERGLVRDTELAAQLDASTVVPVLKEYAFRL